MKISLCPIPTYLPTPHIHMHVLVGLYWVDDVLDNVVILVIIGLGQAWRGGMGLGVTVCCGVACVCVCGSGGQLTGRLEKAGG